MVALLLIMLFPSSQEVASEVDIFGALTDVFRETDPAVVMGYAGTPAVTLATVHPACLAIGMSQSDAEWEHKRIMQHANSVGIRRTAAARGGRSKPGQRTAGSPQIIVPYWANCNHTNLLSTYHCNSKTCPSGLWVFRRN